MFILDISNGNVKAALAEYFRRYPSRRTLSSKTFSEIYRTLREIGILAKLPTLPTLSELNRQERENIHAVVRNLRVVQNV